MRNLILILLFSGAMLTTGYAQSKKGCKPEACGPNNTKVAEAKVITKLRHEVKEVKVLIHKADLEMKEANIGHKTIKHLPLDIQNNSEDATLLLLFMDVACLKETLALEDEQKEYNSKAQLVASLRSDLSQMKDQLTSN